jgi:hypothetical protein
MGLSGIATRNVPHTIANASLIFPSPNSPLVNSQGRLASGVLFNNARRMKNGNIPSDIVLIAHGAEYHWRAGWVFGFQQTNLNHREPDRALASLRTRATWSAVLQCKTAFANETRNRSAGKWGGSKLSGNMSFKVFAVIIKRKYSVSKKRRRPQNPHRVFFTRTHPGGRMLISHCSSLLSLIAAPSTRRPFD